MKTLSSIIILLSFLSVIFASCTKSTATVEPKYDTADRFSPEEMKWINYKLNDKIKFFSNKNIDTIVFLVENVRIYNYYQSYHTAIIGRIYLTNLNQQLNITNIGFGINKNSSSAKIGGIMTNNIGFELYNSKTATGMFPSVNATSRPYAISEDIRDTDSFVLPTYKNFTVNNKIYQNVYKLQMQFNKNIGATYLYVNRDFGFLRIDFEDGEVWERVL